MNLKEALNIIYVDDRPIIVLQLMLGFDGFYVAEVIWKEDFK